MADTAPTIRHGSFRLTVAICGGAILGGSLAALICLVAVTCGYKATVTTLAVWAGIGAVCGAIHAGTHVGLHLHREWLEATVPHEHEHEHEHEH